MLLEQITLSNLLSFGKASDALALRRLNIVIGLNGSGKSNLLEAIDLLRCAPDQIVKPIREGGGIRDWLWKGQQETPAARIDAVLANPKGPTSLRYAITFTEVAQRFQIIDERVENDKPDAGHSDVYFYYRFQNGHPAVNIAGKRRALQRETIDIRTVDPGATPGPGAISGDYLPFRDAAKNLPLP